MKELDVLLRESCASGILSWSQEKTMAEAAGLSLRELEDRALTLGILPIRYKRNRKSFNIEDQHRLLHSRVTVIGCGGLGGFVIEELCRLGVGAIQAWDYDDFAEHNLNRQLLLTMKLIGQSKVQVAARRAKAINPVVDFQTINALLDKKTGREKLPGQQVVVDALDHIPSRLLLAELCNTLGIPLVHGAIAGWYGQVTTLLPGDDTLEKLYQHCIGGVGGIEKDQGIMAFTPATVASIQVAEVIKLLLGHGELLNGRVLMIDLLDLTFEIMQI